MLQRPIPGIRALPGKRDYILGVTPSPFQKKFVLLSVPWADPHPKGGTVYDERQIRQARQDDQGKAPRRLQEQGEMA
jgi:hypothetical protein